jgi:hypothetical protein
MIQYPASHVSIFCYRINYFDEINSKSLSALVIDSANARRRADDARVFRGTRNPYQGIIPWFWLFGMSTILRKIHVGVRLSPIDYCNCQYFYL